MARTSANAPADVAVTVRAGTITAPDSVSPGWRRVRVDETDGEHIVVVFRLPAVPLQDDPKQNWWRDGAVALLP